MSFFSEKVLKRPSAEEIRGYSPRELEIAKKNYNYGHNVCFYTVMLCFIIWAILCSVFRPDIAHASELTEGEVQHCFKNYLIFQESYGSYTLFVDVSINGALSDNGSVTFSGGKVGSYSTVEGVINALSSASYDSFNGVLMTSQNVSRFVFSDVDFHDSNGSLVFQKTPLVTETTVGGLTAPEIAKMTVVQILGLVPLVLGLAISAIGLRKALAMVYQRLRRA